MRPATIILVVVAAAAAGTAGLLAKRWTDARSAASALPQTQQTEILVIARDVAAGAVLTDADLRWEAWPAASAARFTLRSNGEDSKVKAVGAAARRALTAGEPLMPNSIFSRDGAGIMSGMLGAGMRAVSVPISNSSAVSGFIVPGDRVDVVLAADFQRADSEAAGKGGAIVRYAAETVLSDVKVLAVDQQFAKGKDAPTIQGKTATLEVAPKQAETLMAAGLMGQLSLVLRGSEPQQDSPSTGRRAYTPDTEASAAMRALAGMDAPRREAAKSGSSIIVNRGGIVGGGAP